MPLTSRAKKQRVVIQCVTRTKAEWRGTGFVTSAVETRLGTEASAGSWADPDVGIFGLHPRKTWPGRTGIILPLYRVRRTNHGKVIHRAQEHGWAACGESPRVQIKHPPGSC